MFFARNWMWIDLNRYEYRTPCLHIRYWNTHINSQLSMTNLRSDVPKLGIFNRGEPINCSAVCLKKLSIPICKWKRSEGMSQIPPILLFAIDHFFSKYTLYMLTRYIALFEGHCSRSDSSAINFLINTSAVSRYQVWLLRWPSALLILWLGYWAVYLMS